MASALVRTAGLASIILVAALRASPVDAAVYISGRVLVQETKQPVTDALVQLYAASPERPGTAGAPRTAALNTAHGEKPRPATRGTKPAAPTRAVPESAAAPLHLGPVAPLRVGPIAVAGASTETPLLTTRALRNGTYILRAPGPGRYRIVVDLPDYMPFSQMITVPPAGLPSLDLLLSRPPTVRLLIHGPDGKPVTTGTVQEWLLVGIGGLEAQGSWKTSKPTAEGAVEISTPRSVTQESVQQVGVAVRVPGVGFASLTLPHWPDAPVTLALQTGETLTGKVVDADGHPVKGAAIGAAGMALDLGARFLQGWDSTRSGEDGSFQFQDLTPGRYDLYNLQQQAPGGQGPRFHRVDVPASTEPVLTPNDPEGALGGFMQWGGAAPSGSVQFALNAPIGTPPAAPISVSGQLVMSGGKPGPAGITLALYGRGSMTPNQRAYPVDVTATGDDGKFTLQAPAPGVYQLSNEFSYDSEYNPASRDLTIPREGLTGVSFPLGVRPTLALKLTAPDGKLVTQGKVQISMKVGASSGGWSTGGEDAPVDKNGIARAHVYNSMDTTTVTSVVAAVHGDAGSAVVKLDSWPTAPVLVTLLPGATLQGHVMDGAGRAVTAGHVTAMFFSDAQPFAGFQSMGDAPIGQDGTFALHGLPTGVFYLLAQSTSNDSRSLLARVPGPPVTIRFGQGIRLRGQVLDPEGRPVAGAHITVSPINVQYQWANINGQQDGGMTDQTGLFTITGLQPGNYVIMAALQGQSRAARALYLAPGKEQLLVLRMDQGQELSVHVVDAAGKPAAGAAVSMYHVPENAQWPNLEGNFLTTPAGPGQFVVKDMLPGSYIVSATLPGGKTRVRAFTLTPALREIDLTPADDQ